MKAHGWIIFTGIVAGLAALVLNALGNPGNMGFCVACFLRDTAGACRLHGNEALSYVRPEITGLVLGACALSLFRREWKAKGGSSPLTRFALGFCLMVGALTFLGCPLRMLIRLGGGDLNALTGLLGFVAGVFVGVCFLKRGFSLRRAYPQNAVEGAIAPAGLAALLIGSAAFFATTAAHAPAWASLLCAFTVGALAQKSRFCMAGGWRDAFLFKDFHLLYGSLALLATVAVGNLVMGRFHLGFEGQPVAHTDHLMNLLGMLLVGLCSVLLGGCPMRQLALTGEGSSDAAITVLGMAIGAACAHNFGWAASGAGTTAPGRAALFVCLTLTVLLAFGHRERKDA